MPKYSLSECITEISAQEKQVYELLDKGDAGSLRVAKTIVHELAKTLRGVLEDMDAEASRPPRHSRILTKEN